MRFARRGKFFGLFVLDGVGGLRAAHRMFAKPAKIIRTFWFGGRRASYFISAWGLGSCQVTF